MSAAEEMSGLVRFIASPSDGESVKTRIGKAASKLGMSTDAVKRIWYRELKVIPTEMSDHIRSKAAAHDRNLKANMVSAAAAMLEADPEFYRDQIEAIGQLLFRDGNEARQSGNRH